MDTLSSEGLRKQFADMYYILDEMRNKKNLLPATTWARTNSISLEARGSNLEFELGKSQFVWLFTGPCGGDRPNSTECQQAALTYAREEFGNFQGRYLREIQQLVGAMAFCPNLMESPYRHIFHNDEAWENLAMSFTREFCSLLGLSADSPLYIASTAGVIALPTLLKLQTIMKEKRTEWTTQHELPVGEILNLNSDTRLIIKRSRYRYRQHTSSIRYSYVQCRRNRQPILILQWWCLVVMSLRTSHCWGWAKAVGSSVRIVLGNRILVMRRKFFFEVNHRYAQLSKYAVAQGFEASSMLAKGSRKVIGLSFLRSIVIGMEYHRSIGVSVETYGRAYHYDILPSSAQLLQHRAYSHKSFIFLLSGRTRTCVSLHFPALPVTNKSNDG